MTPNVQLSLVLVAVSVSERGGYHPGLAIPVSGSPVRAGGHATDSNPRRKMACHGFQASKRNTSWRLERTTDRDQDERVEERLDSSGAPPLSRRRSARPSGPPSGSRSQTTTIVQSSPHQEAAMDSDMTAFRAAAQRKMAIGAVCGGATRRQESRTLHQSALSDLRRHKCGTTNSSKRAARRALSTALATSN